jgi:Prolipoprotein diacylglyceryl transferase
MNVLVDFIQLRGEYVSLLAAGALLWLSVRPTARLLGVGRTETGDLFWNASIAFVVIGRIAYLIGESPQTLFDPFVLIRLQGGLEPLAGIAGVAAVVAWRAKQRQVRWAVGTTGAVGLAVATVGYDLACVIRDACYGAPAPVPLGFRMSGLSEPRLATPLIETALVLVALAVLLTFARQLSARSVPLLLVGVLALVRAALTPLSALGVEAVGVGTIVLVISGVSAVVAAAALDPRASEWMSARRP